MSPFAIIEDRCKTYKFGDHICILNITYRHIKITILLKRKLKIVACVMSVVASSLPQYQGSGARNTTVHGVIHWSTFGEFAVSVMSLNT